MSTDLFADLRKRLPSDPNLMEAEREQLRFLSANEGPLYKLVKSAYEHAEFLKETIASIPLTTPDNIAAARDLQVQMNSAKLFLAWFVQCYALPPQQPQKQETPNG